MPTIEARMLLSLSTRPCVMPAVGRNWRSSLMTSTLTPLSMLSEEWPVPKSSMRTVMPMARRRPTTSLIIPWSCM